MKNIIFGMLALVMVISFAGNAMAQDEAGQKCDSIFTMKNFSMDSVEYFYKCEMTKDALYKFKYAEDQVTPGEVITAIVPLEKGLKGTPERVVNTTEFEFEHRAKVSGTYFVTLYKKGGGKDAKRLAPMVSNVQEEASNAADDATKAVEEKVDEAKGAAGEEMSKAEKKAMKEKEKAEAKAKKEAEKAKKAAEKAAAKAAKTKDK